MHMKNWKIRTRLIAGFVVIIAITIILGLFAANRAQNSSKQGDRLSGNYLPSVISMYRVQVNLYHRTEALLKLVASSDPTVMARLNTEIAAMEADTAKDLQTYEATPTETQREKDVYAESKVTRASFLTVFEEVRRVGSIGTDAENAHAQKIFDEQLQPLYEKYAGELQQVVEINRVGADSSMKSIQDSVHDGIRGIILGLFLSVAFAIPIAFFLVRSITLPLGQAVTTLEHVAAGDLTVSLAIDTKDEIGAMAKALNSAVSKIRNTLRGVAEGAANTNSISQKLAAAADIIASGAQEQSASLEETSASLEEITAAVRQSADNADQARAMATQSKESAEGGQAIVTTAISAMGEINAASAKISDIISTVNEIAFQTNLLAVNAAIEAARAGELGLGFAVVASEVRSLAQRSAIAAKEIRALIQDSLDRVEKGTELVNRSGATLQDIVSSVRRVTDTVSEIAAAAGEQSTGIEQVNTAVTQMDQVTQANAAQTEQLSSTAQTLAGTSQRLSELVSTFKLDDDREFSRSHQSLPGSPSPAPNLPRKTAIRVPAASSYVVSPSTRTRAVHSTVLAVKVAAGDDSFEGL